MARAKKKVEAAAEPVAEEQKEILETIEKEISEKLENTIKNSDFVETNKVIGEIEESIGEKVEEMLTPIVEMAKEVEDLTKNKVDITNKSIESQEDARKVVERELSRAKALKAKLESAKNNRSFTNYWNGTSYGF